MSKKTFLLVWSAFCLFCCVTASIELLGYDVVSIYSVKKSYQKYEYCSKCEKEVGREDIYRNEICPHCGDLSILFTSKTGVKQETAKILKIYFLEFQIDSKWVYYDRSK